ncbi:hypothetical protein BJ742DRAFT_521278 [Cladochytrium replicatum]|nr:hypothetical protein BJ742DRAFT_521278 [Cladochytrium replicatum]
MIEYCGYRHKAIMFKPNETLDCYPAENQLKKHPCIAAAALKQKCSECERSGDEQQFLSLLHQTFSFPESLLHAFRNQADSIDLLEVRDFYAAIVESKYDAGEAIVDGHVALLEEIRSGRNTLAPSETAVLLIILLNPQLLIPEYMSTVVADLCYVLARANFLTKCSFKKVSGRALEDTSRQHGIFQAQDLFQRVVGVLQMHISDKLMLSIANLKKECVTYPVQVLALLYELNEEYRIIPHDRFYNETIEAMLDFKEDYMAWRTKEGFSFCSFPFVLSTTTKGDLLKIESMIQMRHNLQDAFFRAMFIGVNSPYLQMEVRRDSVFRDALFQLAGKSVHDLKKQLRISFVGEEGIDEGGVQKEFFQLITKEMFEPTYGMFTTNPQSRYAWPASDPNRDEAGLEEFNLLGRLIGVAIYNGIVLDLPFPLALYKKLMSMSVGFEDLNELDPALYQGLEKLLSFQGDVETVFQRSFQIDHETITGDTVTVDLKPEGRNIPVTSENCREFVNLYADYILNKSIEREFTAFCDGFNIVLSGSALQLFRAEELQELVCGSPEMDFSDLEDVTQYEGFTKDSEVIREFWKIVNEFTEEDKKKLLFFVTGSDRVPAGGLSRLQFVIARNGTDDSRLPTSHTCYNVLLLCDSLVNLKSRLQKALENCNCGFFLT